MLRQLFVLFLLLTTAISGQVLNTNLSYFPVTPCRLLDTRVTSNPLGAGEQRTLNFTSSCALNSSARAYALNITLIPIGSSTPEVTVWPSGTRPNTPSILDPEGRLISNHLIIPADNSGLIQFYSTQATDVLIDVGGYWKADDSGYVYYPIPSCRLVDTRYPAGGSDYIPPIDQNLGQGKIPASTSTVPGAGFNVRQLPLSGAMRCGTIPSEAKAFIANLTVKPTTTLGYLTVWPFDPQYAANQQILPTISNLNDLDGRWLSNNAIIPNLNGTLNVFANNETDLLVDITGYFAPRTSIARGMVLNTVRPCRVLNTTAFVAPPSSLVVPTISSSCSIGSAAQAVALNATVKPAPLTQFSYLTIWPRGSLQPVTSVFNALEGYPISNGMVTLGGQQGDLLAFGTNNGTLEVDVFGYFTFPTADNNIPLEPAVEINLSFIPIDRYFDINGNGGDSLLTCSPSVTVQECYRRFIYTDPLSYTTSQNIKGVRFMFGVNGGFASTVWDANGAVRPAWVLNLRAFLSDLKTWGVKRVSPTPALWGAGDNGEYQNGNNPPGCNGQGLKFYKWLPFGIASSGHPDCLYNDQAYSTATRGEQFWGWAPYFNMWAAIFQEIKTAQLEVGNIDVANELDIVDFTVQGRLILDCPTPTTCTDVLTGVRSAAASKGIDSWLVSYSTPNTNPSFWDPSLGASPLRQYCSSVYGDSALIVRQSALNSALEGAQGFFGRQAIVANDGNPGNWLNCGNPPANPSQMLKAWDKPRVIDVHPYPCIIQAGTALCSPGTDVTAISKKMNDAMWDFMYRTGQTAAAAVIGETYPNQSCDGYPIGFTSQGVAGLKASSIYSNSKMNLIVRPWNNPAEHNAPIPPATMEWSCYIAPSQIIPPYSFP